MSLTPLILATLSFVVGIIISNFLNEKFYQFFLILVYITFILTVVFAVRKNRIYKILLLLLFLFFSSAFTLKKKQTFSKNLNILRKFEKKEVAIKGKILSHPYVKYGNEVFILKINSINKNKINGRILVYLRQRNNKKIYRGQILFIKGKLAFPKSRYYFNWKRHFYYREILAVLFGRDITVIEEKNILVFFSKLRTKIEEIIDTILPLEYSSTLKAILLGRKRELSKFRLSTFRKTGIIHILTVSGLHVGLILLSGYLFFSSLGISIRLTILLITVLIVFYTFIIGDSLPVYRASIMSICGLLAYFLGRDKHLYNSLFLAALILLFINPFSLFYLSFQLSFLSVFGILYLFGFFENLFSFLPGVIAKSFAISCSAQLFIYPLLAYNFGEISLISPLTNIVVIPIVWIIVSNGLVGIIVYIFVPILGVIYGYANQFFILALTKTVEFLGSFSFASVELKKPSLLFFVIYYLILLSFPMFYRKLQSKK